MDRPVLPGQYNTHALNCIFATVLVIANVRRIHNKNCPKVYSGINPLAIRIDSLAPQIPVTTKGVPTK